MTAGRDPKKPFTPSEMKSIQIAVSHLQEFHAGAVFILRLRRRGLAARNRQLDYFFEIALIAYLDGFYPPNRNDAGILPVLRLVGCNTMADEIEASLDRKVGSSTYATMMRTFRNKVISHPRFGFRPMRAIVDDFQAHLQQDEDIAAFIEAGNTIKERTAGLYVWFKLSYPEIVEHVDSVDEKDEA